MNFLKTYDVIFLSECWMNKDFCFDTDNFVCKSFPRLKSKCIQGGGMFLMIKNTLAQFISICECMFDTLVWLKFHKKLFDFNEDVYMCCAYIPPSNSSHHALYDCELFRVLENSITTYSTKGKLVSLAI